MKEIITTIIKMKEIITTIIKWFIIICIITTAFYFVCPKYDLEVATNKFRLREIVRINKITGVVEYLKLGQDKWIILEE